MTTLITQDAKYFPSVPTLVALDKEQKILTNKIDPELHMPSVTRNLELFIALASGVIECRYNTDQLVTKGNHLLHVSIITATMLYLKTFIDYNH